VSYETLDSIADAYIPILSGLFLVGLVGKLYKNITSYRFMLVKFSYLIVLLIISYGIMFFDNATKLFPLLGLDYSTHTAVALSLVYALCLLLANRWKKIIVSSMLMYAGLMLYQGYHTMVDMVVTAAVISMFAFGVYKLMIRLKI
jgi:hypothetical protein